MHNQKSIAKSTLFLLLIALSLCNVTPALSQTATQKHVVANVSSVIKGYYESLPADYNTQTSKKYPVILFLHGLGEIGDGNSQISRVLTHGPAKLISQNKFPAKFRVNGQDFSFIVISPQLNSNARNAATVADLINYVVAKYRVDETRIYLTGLSMGGGISWIYAGGSASNPKRIAALVPICANTQPYAGNVKHIAAANLPVKMFHSESDPTVPSSYSKNWQSQLNAAGIKPAAQLTIWPGSSHDAWSKAYDPTYKENGLNIYEWMLTHTTNGSVTPAPAPNVAPTANAGNDITITLPANSVNLQGSGTDPDGTIVSSTWTKVSGPLDFLLGSLTNLSTLLSKLTEGVYEFELTVTDNKGATGKDRVKVTVLPAAPVANKPPVASAGSNQTISLPATSVTLKGTASDPDGTISTIEWTKTAGPSQFSLGSKNALQTNVTNLVAGTYTFQLKVVDNKGAAATSNVNVVVNQAATGGGSTPPPSGDCGCTVTLPRQADGGIYIDGSKISAKPGDVVCIQAGTYPYLNLQNFQGTAAKPIIFRNCGGQVIIAGKNYGVSISRSAHFKFDGTGASGVKYGFKIDGSSNGRTMSNGLGVSNQSTDFTINNVELTAIGGAGIMVKTNPTCDPVTWGGNFVMRNIVLHTIYIHDIKGEGFYVGSTNTTADITCDGVKKTVKTQAIENLKLYNSITDKTGWDGIQVANVPVNCEVYNNTVTNYGTENKSSQQAGILFGGLCNGKFYNNTVNKGTGNGIQVLGVGYIVGYNNLVVNAGHDGSSAKQDAIYVDDRPVTGFPALYVYLANNTVVNAGRSGIRLENSKKSIVSVNKFNNNLVVAPGSTSATDGFIAVRNGAKSSLGGNKFITKLADAGFVNSASDFRLSSKSSAIDAGVSISEIGVSKDLDGLARLVGSATDAGAYEYQTGTSAPANKKPVANAGSDIVKTLPDNSVTLDGGKSTDEDGNITSYKWTKVSGPTSFNISAASASSTQVTGLVQGVYEFELVVTDNKGETASDRVKVTINAAPINQNPVASAGSDVTITLPANSATLSGTGSKDVDGQIKSYKWTKVSGPSSYSIANAGAASTAVNNLVQGVYEFELQVTDDKGATGNDRVVINVLAAVPSAANKAPIANAGADIARTLPTNTATLDGSKSSDPDGSISTYKWSKTGGPSSFKITSPSAAVTNVTDLVAGVYDFALEVTDNKGATHTDWVRVTVSPAPAPTANKAPIADAGPDKSIKVPASMVTVHGTGSKDEDGTIVSYLWSKISGPSSYQISNPENPSTNITKLVGGRYEFELKVTDNKGATATDRVWVNVDGGTPAAANQAPVANAGSDITITLPANSATLNGGNSKDADGKIVTYKWSKIGGPSAFTLANSSAASTTVSGLTQGVYQFELVVTDDKGATGKDQVTITINAAPKANAAPVANAGADQSIKAPASSVTLSASGSTDSDGKLVAYKWTKISGPSSYAFSAATAVSTTVSKLTEGVYVFEVTITDDKGATASDRVTVEVKGITVPSAGKGSLVANAGADQVITLPVNNIVLSGAGTIAPNGKITAYEWTKVSGPAKYNFRAGKSSVNPVINLEEGVYVFRLKVTDVTGATSTDDVTITVKPVKTVATSNNSARVETVVAEELKLYPVPVNDILNFSYQSNNQQEKLLVSIVDANGRVVMKFSFEKNDYKLYEELNLSQLKQGVYFFQLDSKKVHNLVQKFVKN